MAEENRAWTYGAIATIVPIVYFVIVMSQVPSTEVSQIDYLGPLVTAIVVSMVLNMFLAPQGGKTDERDRNVAHFSGNVAFIVMSALTVIPLVLAVLRVDQFWIANSLYLAFALSAVTQSAVKIVAYRRGV